MGLLHIWMKELALDIIVKRFIFLWRGELKGSLSYLNSFIIWINYEIIFLKTDIKYILEQFSWDFLILLFLCFFWNIFAYFLIFESNLVFFGLSAIFWDVLWLFKINWCKFSHYFCHFITNISKFEVKLELIGVIEVSKSSEFLEEKFHEAKDEEENDLFISWLNLQKITSSYFVISIHKSDSNVEEDHSTDDEHYLVGYDLPFFPSEVNDWDS